MGDSITALMGPTRKINVREKMSVAMVRVEVFRDIEEKVFQLGPCFTDIVA